METIRIFYTTKLIYVYILKFDLSNCWHDLQSCRTIFLLYMTLVLLSILAICLPSGATGLQVILTVSDIQREI